MDITGVMGAYATDYLEKNWPTSYGGRGGNYDGEGTRKSRIIKEVLSGIIVKEPELLIRTYGEFADDYKANIPVLEEHFCPYYTSWDETVRDTPVLSMEKRF